MDATSDGTRDSARSAGEQLRLRISPRRVGSAVVLEVAGEVDLTTAARLQATISESLELAAGAPVVVDLLRVQFLGSHGLRALTEAALAAEKRPAPLRLVVDHHRPVLRPIEITGLETVLTLYHSLPEALLAP